jgi:hypothetical protein
LTKIKIGGDHIRLRQSLAKWAQGARFKMREIDGYQGERRGLE